MILSLSYVPGIQLRGRASDCRAMSPGYQPFPTVSSVSPNCPHFQKKVLKDVGSVFFLITMLYVMPFVDTVECTSHENTENENKTTQENYMVASLQYAQCNISIAYFNLLLLLFVISLTFQKS
jgi:hypothetical protein